MNIDIVRADCLNAMREIEADQVDAVITDPPYCSGGVTEAGRGTATHQGLRSEAIRNGRFQWFDGDVMTTAGLRFLLREVAVEAQRILKPTGHLLMFADWRMVPMLSPAIESSGLRFRSLIVWDKGSMGCGLGFRPQHEMIMHFTGRSPLFHAADVGNVIRCPRVPSAQRQHPAQKPVSLMRDLIRVAVPPGGLVLDPFAGSGTTGIAADQIGRRAILIERDASIELQGRERIQGSAPLLAGLSQ